MRRSVIVLVVVVALSADLAGGLVAAGPAPVADPEQLLAQAAGLNGLMGPEMKPWHLKATYETFDDEGKSKSAGTFEEWWVSGTRYKRSYVSPGFAQTDYFTEKGLLRTGSMEWVDDVAAEVPVELLEPMVTPAPGKFAMDLREVAAGHTQVRCITLRQKGQKVARPGVICLDELKPALRINTSGGAYRAVYNNPLLFQGHYVARDIQILQNNKAFLNVHVEIVETLDPVEDAQFAAPADAVALQVVDVPARMLDANVLQRVDPHYPQEAKVVRSQGTVVLAVRIGKDGRIGEVRIVRGPPLLQTAARDAVKQWVYKPYLLNGEAVEVETTVRVTFSIESGGRF